jgi:SAM-dependent methyltransferase
LNNQLNHYSDLLAPIYVWMVGGLEAALKQGQQEMAVFQPTHADSSDRPLALDLGAGFGMHSIPLAAMDYSVTAIDSSALLLSTMQKNASELSIRTIEADLTDFSNHTDSLFDLIICMGDTLTHLADQATVERLLAQVARFLNTGAQFITTFRDYSEPPTGIGRFIPVRSDTDRILTCFIETLPTHIVVHDLLHQRDGYSWKMAVSSYRKVRLSPAWVCDSLRSLGLYVSQDIGERGMVRIVAKKH